MAENPGAVFETVAADYDVTPRAAVEALAAEMRRVAPGGFARAESAGRSATPTRHRRACPIHRLSANRKAVGEDGYDVACLHSDHRGACRHHATSAGAAVPIAPGDDHS